MLSMDGANNCENKSTSFLASKASADLSWRFSGGKVPLKIMIIVNREALGVVSIGPVIIGGATESSPYAEQNVGVPAARPKVDNET